MTELTVRQVVDKDTLFCVPGDFEEPFFLHGISTEGIVDGSKIRPKEHVKVTGTKSYTTVQGAKNRVFRRCPKVMDATKDYLPRMRIRNLMKPPCLTNADCLI